jgi:biopolymer transport protein TolR
MAVTTRDGKTQTALAEINMVPFIDVVLVLLIIFMITAPVIQSGLQVDVPTTESVNELTEDLLVVTIDHAQALYLQDIPVNINEIGAKVQEKLPKVKDKKVYFQGDKAVTLGVMVAVMDKLKLAGVQELVFVTKPFEGKVRGQ